MYNFIPILIDCNKHIYNSMTSDMNSFLQSLIIFINNLVQKNISNSIPLLFKTFSHVSELTLKEKGVFESLVFCYTLIKYKM